MLGALRELAEIRGDDPKEVELTGFVNHDLRRTVRTRLSALKVQDHIAEMVIGHGRKGIARIYDQHRFEDEKREALAKWAARLRTHRRAAAGERGRTQGDESVVTLLPHESLPDGAIDRIVAAVGHVPR